MDALVPHWLTVTVAVLLVAPAASVIAAVVLQAVIDRLIRPTRAPVAARVMRAGRRPVRVAGALLGVIAALNAVELPRQAHAASLWLAGFTLTGVLGWLAVRKVQAVYDAWLDRPPRAGEDPLHARRRRTQLVVFRRLTVSVVVMLTIGLLLTEIPAVRTVGLSLFASAGVAGVVAGIAARPVFTNLFAGLQLALTQPIRIGDALVIEGAFGWVEEITATYVTIRTWDERSLVVPLGWFLDRPIQNWTHDTTHQLDTVFLYVDYTAPVAAIRRKVAEVLEASPLWDRRVGVVQVTDLREQVMEIRVLVSAADSGRAFDLRCLVREELVNFLAGEHPSVLPQSRLTLDQEDMALIASSGPMRRREREACPRPAPTAQAGAEMRTS